MAHYPDSKVELSGFMARHYDGLITAGTLGTYASMIRKAVRAMNIQQDDRILELGAGTGRNACLMSRYLGKNGRFLGLDISSEMISQFNKQCKKFPNIRIANERIDIDFAHQDEFNKVFISFVLHGFPQEARLKIIRNAAKSLDSGGEFFILDYGEIPLKDMPFFVRGPFKAIECPYAFDYMEKDWKAILAAEGFENFTEVFFYRGYLRLLRGVKTP